jgi:hypothetical protein
MDTRTTPSGPAMPTHLLEVRASVLVIPGPHRPLGAGGNQQSGHVRVGDGGLALAVADPFQGGAVQSTCTRRTGRGIPTACDPGRSVTLISSIEGK